MTPIAICHRCPDRQRPCAGACLCKLDGVDIIEHSRSAYCPAGRYQLGLGDKIAGVLHKTGVGPAYLKARSVVTKKPCGCPRRIKWWNRLFPSKKAVALKLLDETKPS